MKPIELKYLDIVGFIILAAGTSMCLYYNLIPSSVGSAILSGLVGLLLPTSYNNFNK